MSSPIHISPQWEQITLQKKTYKNQIWDIAGQEMFSSMTKNQIRGEFAKEDNSEFDETRAKEDINMNSAFDKLFPLVYEDNINKSMNSNYQSNERSILKGRPQKNHR